MTKQNIYQRGLASLALATALCTGCVTTRDCFYESRDSSTEAVQDSSTLLEDVTDIAGSLLVDVVLSSF